MMRIISTATPIMTSDWVFFGITPFGLGALSSIAFGGFGIFSGLSGIAGAPSLRVRGSLRRAGRLRGLRQPIEERLGLAGLLLAVSRYSTISRSIQSQVT